MKTQNVRNFAIVAVAAMLLATSAISISTSTQSAFAYKKNQATSQANACGNDFFPTNVGCQNTGSQIQGDENSVALAAQQTFPEAAVTPPTPQNCEDCFDTRPDGPWPPGLLTQLEDFLAEGVTFHGVEIFSVADLCEVLVAAAATADPVTVGELEELLNAALPGEAAPPVIARTITCLLELGLIVDIV